jgi:Protein of unknown function (DUF1173)
MTIEVKFDNRSFALEDVLEFPARYVRELERSRKSPGWAECLCQTTTPALRLVIRRYGQMYHLAGWPDDGHRHRIGCPFRKDAVTPGTPATAADAAIRKTADGLNVRLDAALNPVSGEAKTPSDAPAAPGTARQARRSASLLAFARALWVEARLNVWGPQDQNRNWGACCTALQEAVGNGPINGEPAERALHVMRRFDKEHSKALDTELTSFLEALKRPDGSSRRALVVGEIAEVAPSKFGQTITLRQNVRKYFVDNRLIAQAEKSYRFAWPAIGNGQARVIAVLLVEYRKGYAAVVDLAAMLCSSRFIPCDSMLEVQMANRLTRDRRFEKPLAPNSDQILADFVLTDTPQLVEIEVYGLNGQDEYEKRKREKQAIRARRGVQCVEWNADREPLDAVHFPATC